LQGSVLAGARRPPNMRRQPEGRFPSLRLSAGCRFRKETIAGMRGNARDAPFLAVALRAEPQGGAPLGGAGASGAVDAQLPLISPFIGNDPLH
jgi:hypothetical protein